MAAVKIYRGDTWQRAWVLTDASGAPLDLTGASARLHARDAAGAKVMVTDTWTISASQKVLPAT